MGFEERCGEEILAAGMAHARGDLHARNHGTVRGLGLNGTAGIERPPGPDPDAAAGGVGVAAEGAFVGLLLFFEAVHVVGEHGLRERNVNLAPVLPQQLFPADAPGAQSRS